MFRLLLSCVAISTILAAAPGPQAFRPPMVFEPNRGQAPATVKWIVRATGYLLLLTTDGATIVLADPSPEAPKEDQSPRVFQPTLLPLASSKAAVSTVQMKLTGSRSWNEMDGVEPTGGVSNYLIGSDPKRWRLGIPHYANVTARQVYDGVDLVFYGQGDHLEYDFVVAPGADPKQIRLAFDGVDRLRVDKSGDLVLTTASGSELRHMRPKVYQQVGNERVEVAAGYDVLDRRRATFTLAAYDRRRPLIIDPIVAFNTRLAGTDTDIIAAQAVDGSGNVYVTGTTNSTNYPVTEGYQGNQPGDDAFVTKLSSTGGIVFSTYLGGKDTDNGTGIAVDSTGIYVTGLTASSDFPKKNPFNQTVRIYDGFITKFNLNGDTLIYSSYLGGSNYDYAYGVAVDAAQAAWVVGVTESKDFPIAGGPSAGQQRKYGGNWDGFMARVAPDGLSVRFSTFVGGPNLDQLRDVAVDRTGSVYATGFAAKGFPVTTGMKACVADFSAIAVRKKGPGAQLPYSTCLGPGEGTGIAVDAGFNVYISGDTTGKFPTTLGVFQRNKPTTNPLGRSGFVTKLGLSGKVVYATYLGGNFDTFGGQIAVDGRGDVYVGSATRATKFPGAPPLPLNTQNGFLSKLTGQGKNLAYTLIMGEVVSDVTVFQGTSPTPPLYVSGATKVSGNYDSFVTKLE